MKPIRRRLLACLMIPLFVFAALPMTSANSGAIQPCTDIDSGNRWTTEHPVATCDLPCKKFAGLAGFVESTDLEVDATDIDYNCADQVAGRTCDRIYICGAVSPGLTSREAKGHCKGEVHEVWDDEMRVTCYAIGGIADGDVERIKADLLKVLCQFAPELPDCPSPGSDGGLGVDADVARLLEETIQDTCRKATPPDLPVPVDFDYMFPRTLVHGDVSVLRNSLFYPDGGYVSFLYLDDTASCEVSVGDL